MTQPQQHAPGSDPAAVSGDPAPVTTASVPGRFVWHDLMSTDPAAALRFYETLFGWTLRAMPMGDGSDYTMVHVGEESVGGVVPLDRAHGVRSHWIGYLTVGSVDEADERAPALGGTRCVQPTDIPTIGRFAVLSDATGAVFSPFTFVPGQETPEPTAVVPYGAFCWDELLTTDPEAAAAFYTGLVGWRYERMDMGELGSYWIARRGETQASGMMQLPDEALQAGARSHWLPYVHVADVDATARQAAGLGGQVMVAPMDVPGIGRMAVLRDPSDALVAVFRGLGY